MEIEQVSITYTQVSIVEIMSLRLVSVNAILDFCFLDVALDVGLDFFLEEVPCSGSSSVSV